MTEINIPVTYQTIKTKLESIVARTHYTKTEINTQMASKQDVGDCITSIALVPKGNDSTADAYNGVIRLYYGDEPSS